MKEITVRCKLQQYWQHCMWHNSNMCSSSDTALTNDNDNRTVKLLSSASLADDVTDRHPHLNYSTTNASQRLHQTSVSTNMSRFTSSYFRLSQLRWVRRSLDTESLKTTVSFVVGGLLQLSPSLGTEGGQRLVAVSTKCHSMPDIISDTGLSQLLQDDVH